MGEERSIVCGKCKALLGILKGINRLETKYKSELTGVAYGRRSGAYIECECGHREGFIY